MAFCRATPDPEKFKQQLTAYTAELKLIKVEVDKLAEQSPAALSKYQQGEVKAVASWPASGYLAKLLPSVEQLMLQLADICEPTKEPYAKRKSLSTKPRRTSRATDPKTVKKASAATPVAFDRLAGRH